MRNFILTITLLVFCPFVFGQGVNFENLTFNEALAKAKAEDKLVFMDCYTSWCGPCKRVAETIFTQEEVGTFFDREFVCVKFDMEKGEGMKLREKFQILAFPTFLIFRPDGTIQHKIVGALKLDEFMSLVKKGIRKKTSLDYQNKRYEKGKMSRKELIDYQIALFRANEKETFKKVSKELVPILKNKDKLRKDYWLIMRIPNEYSADNFEFVVNHLAEFNKIIDRKELNKFLASFLRVEIQRCDYSFDLARIKQIRQKIMDIDFDEKERLLDDCDLMEASKTGDVDKVIMWYSQRNLEGRDASNLTTKLIEMKELATKEQLERMAALKDKFMAMATSEGVERYLEYIFDSFKIAAQVGVFFQDLTYEQALTKAQEKQKRLFIDCYSRDCDTCQYMQDTVFKQEDVGDFFNENFICVKYDMKLGKSSELEEKFEVHAYPTFIIVNPDGSICDKFTGRCEGKEFIKRVKDAFDK